MKFPQLTDQSPLRPIIVLNIMLVVIILGIFGFSHTWLGMRQQEKEKEVKRLQEQIQQTQHEIRRLNVDVNHNMSNGALFTLIEDMNLQLQRFSDDEAILLKTASAADSAASTTAATP
jgi:cell division protein FtsL